jgi:hypothetical protein
LATPGEPTSFASEAAANAPFRPATLSVESTTWLSPAELSNVAKGPLGAAPKETVACSVPPPSKRLTASPPVLSPTPEPE